MVGVVQCLLALALLVVHSQGQSEGITGLVDKSALTEWSRINVQGTRNSILGSDIGRAGVQYLFSGLKFRCNGRVTKWIIGGKFNGGGGSHNKYPALGIYGPKEGNFADRVGASVFVHETAVRSRVYEFTPDSPLPFRNGDSLGISVPFNNDARLKIYSRLVTDGPAFHNYTPSSLTPEGESRFDFGARNASHVWTSILPLVAVEIESDDPDSADCTRDFMNRDVLELLAHRLSRRPSLQSIFPSYSFTGDGVITNWTVAAKWHNNGYRLPELQVWRRNGPTYEKIGHTTMAAAVENPKQLYSGTIDPPLQFQSGDVLGMFSPPNFSGSSDPDATAKLIPTFGQCAEPTLNRIARDPLSSMSVLGEETQGYRPYLALGIVLYPTISSSAISTATTPEPPTTDNTSPSTTEPPTTDNANPTSTSTFVTDGPSSQTVTIAIAVLVVVLLLAVLIVIIIITVLCCSNRKTFITKHSNSADQLCGKDGPIYDYPIHIKTTVPTKHNEAYATTTMSTAHNHVYGMAPYRGSTAGTAPNQVYDIPPDGNTADAEYEYIH